MNSFLGFKGLLEDKDVSEMECPQVPMLCATLSSIIKNRETEHFDKAVNILWELYEVVPNYPLEMFANLIIDILICVCCLNVIV